MCFCTFFEQKYMTSATQRRRRRVHALHGRGFISFAKRGELEQQFVCATCPRRIKAQYVLRKYASALFTKPYYGSNVIW